MSDNKSEKLTEVDLSNKIKKEVDKKDTAFDSQFLNIERYMNNIEKNIDNMINMMDALYMIQTRPRK
jgi:hypothetical protein